MLFSFYTGSFNCLKTALTRTILSAYTVVQQQFYYCNSFLCTVNPVFKIFVWHILGNWQRRNFVPKSGGTNFRFIRKLGVLDRESRRPGGWGAERGYTPPRRRRGLGTGLCPLPPAENFLLLTLERHILVDTCRMWRTNFDVVVCCAKDAARLCDRFCQ